MQVLNSSVMLTRLLACSFCWLTNTFVYYGLSLNSVAFAGDKYVNFILVAVVEIPAYFLTWFLTDYIGRKATLSSSFLLSGVFCLAIQFVPTGNLDFLWNFLCNLQHLALHPFYIICLKMLEWWQINLERERQVSIDNESIAGSLSFLRLILYMGGKWCITMSFSTIYIYTAELFPTNLRHSLLGICSMTGRMGSILSPQTPLLVSLPPQECTS